MKLILDYNIDELTYTPPVDCKISILGNSTFEMQMSLWEHFVTIKNSTYIRDIDFIDNNVWDGFKNLEIYKLPKKELLGAPIFIISQYINRGYYAFLNIDSSQISLYKNFGGDKFRHELLIFGYDEEKGIVNAADYFDYINYKKGEVAIKELIIAIKSSLEIEDDYLNGVYFLKAEKSPEHYRRIRQGFNWHKFYGELKSLIIPAGSSENYGFYFFSMFEREMNESGCALPIRPYHFIVVHSTFMKRRMLYLKQNGYEIPNELLNSLIDIIRKSQMLKTYHIKCVVRKTAPNLLKECSELRNIRDLYNIFIKQLIKYIEEEIFF